MIKLRHLGGVFALVPVLVAISTTMVWGGERSLEPGRLRRPIALLPLGEAAMRLAILNQRSGSISLLDLATETVVAEIDLAGRIGGGCVVNSSTLAVLDDAENMVRFCRVREDGQTIEQAGTMVVPASPVAVQRLPGGERIVVASTWARQLTVIDCRDPFAPHELFRIDLPFAPRALLFRSDSELFVADAFGGHLALVDLEHRDVLRHRELRATHNVTGMVLSADGATLYLSHQMLNDEQATTAPNVHWGDIMSNVVRKLDVSWFLSDRAEQTTADQIYYLGYPDAAAGDPTGLLVTEAERFIVCLAGVNEVAISDRGLNHFARPAVGRHPVAIWLSAPQDYLYVANHLDDSITKIDVARRRAVRTISLGPQPTLSLADEGELLFYDARLSSDGWYSCHSCHTDGHSNGQRSDTFGDGYTGDAKRVLSLLGSADTRPWSWTGEQATLEGQIRKSIETTMRGQPPTEHQVQAIAAYLMTLKLPPSRTVARGELADARIERGREVFAAQGCTDCHAAPLYTTASTYDVGLEDGNGRREFNPPSLLGVGHRDRLLHDASAGSLREALQVHPAGEPLRMAEEDWLALEAFLQSL